MIFDARVGVTGRDSDRLTQITLEAEKMAGSAVPVVLICVRLKDITAMTDRWFARGLGR